MIDERLCIGDLVKYESRRGKILVGLVIGEEASGTHVECLITGSTGWFNLKFLEKVA